MTATVDPQGDCGDSRDQTVAYANGVVLCASSPTSTICHGDSGAGVIATAGTPVLIGVANSSPTGCPIGGHGLSAYVGAPEILSFIQGNDRPPMALRANLIYSDLKWDYPLVAGSVTHVLGERLVRTRTDRVFVLERGRRTGPASRCRRQLPDSTGRGRNSDRL